MQELDKAYFQTGKVRYIFRDFPLPAHTSAVRAAHAAHCAAEQGRFWEMHEALFAAQDRLGGDHDADFATLRGLAQDLALDADSFMECMDSRKYLDRITEDTLAAGALGLRGTPSYVLDGELLVGLYPAPVWRRMIDRALARHAAPSPP